jgi:sugar-specific transcriptional regulator TrmB
LQRLGLPFNHARVYFALFHAGLSTAKAISKKSGVERSETYRIIAKLEKIGLVERIIYRPCKFRAISICDAFSILMEHRIRKTTELQAKINEIIKKFKNNNPRTALKKDEAQFSLVSEENAVRGKEKQLVTVQRSFDNVSSWKNPHTILFIDMENVAEALQRGVKMRVIIDRPSEKISLSNIRKSLEKYSNFKMRHLLNAPKALMSIYDKKEAWICTGRNPTVEECPTLWTSNSSLLSVLQDYFELMWLTAMEYKP